jgi:hypothetical protein
VQVLVEVYSYLRLDLAELLWKFHEYSTLDCATGTQLEAIGRPFEAGGEKRA